MGLFGGGNKTNETVNRNTSNVTDARTAASDEAILLQEGARLSTSYSDDDTTTTTTTTNNVYQSEAALEAALAGVEAAGRTAERAAQDNASLVSRALQGSEETARDVIEANGSLTGRVLDSNESLVARAFQAGDAALERTIEAITGTVQSQSEAYERFATEALTRDQQTGSEAATEAALGNMKWVSIAAAAAVGLALLARG